MGAHYCSVSPSGGCKTVAAVQLLSGHDSHKQAKPHIFSSEQQNTQKSSCDKSSRKDLSKTNRKALILSSYYLPNPGLNCYYHDLHEDDLPPRQVSKDNRDVSIRRLEGANDRRGGRDNIKAQLVLRTVTVSVLVLLTTFDLKIVVSVKNQGRPYAFDTSPPRLKNIHYAYLS